MSKSYGATRIEVAAAKFVTVAVSQDEARPNLMGVYHDPEGQLVSTDGHRLHIATHMSDRSGRTQNPVTFQTSPDEQSFPAWRKVTADPTTTVTLDVRQLLGAVAGAVEVGKASGRKNPMLTVEFRPDKGTFSVIASVESAHDEAMTGTVLKGEWEGEECVALSINGRYMLEALRAFAVPNPEDEGATFLPVNVGHGGPFSPMQIANDRLTAIIMPMRHDEKRGRQVQCALEAIARKVAELGMDGAEDEESER